MPQRIQRQRTKGWRMPDNAVYVGRPSRWGNPFVVGGFIPPDQQSFFTGIREGGVSLWRGGLVQDRRHAVSLWWYWLLGKVPYTEADIQRLLAGRDLVCWCPLDQPCHAVFLLDIANGEAS